jgi:hypothetical protein
MKSRNYQEINVKDYLLLGETPDHIVSTGLTGEEGASTLHIFYADDRTIVETLGEVENSPATETPGHIAPEEVLRDYLADIADNNR